MRVSLGAVGVLTGLGGPEGLEEVLTEAGQVVNIVCLGPLKSWAAL